MRKMLLLLLASGSLLVASAQQKTIKGRVVDDEGRPVSYATINIQGTQTTVTADIDGAFSIPADGTVTLVVTSAGLQPAQMQASPGRAVTIASKRSSTEMQPVMVGSRRGGRVKTETAVPVDVISVATAMPTGRPDLTANLNYLAPSLNYNKQTGSDGADHIELATLRGLGPDQTLVLVNGKRRHQTSFVSVFGTRGRGNSGTDLNAIPLSAIDRVEILRDGASAQYGSDAIAGVMNLILKRSTKRLTGNVSVSGYNDPEFNTAFAKSLGQYEYGKKIDGRNITAGLNYGFPMGQTGFLNLSVDYSRTGKTYRQVLDTLDPVHNKEGMYLNPYRRAHGDGSLENWGATYNMELPMRRLMTFYSFGLFNHKFSDAFAFSRNFSARPDRFPTDAGGNLQFFPEIMHQTPDGEVYYNPHIQTRVADLSWATGVRGTNLAGWQWDLSNTLGYNRFHFYGDKTFNTSNIGSGQTHFDDGGFTFLQNTINLNMSRQWPRMAQGFSLAVGLEHRYEQYTIFAGEAASYANFSNGDKASGAQGFPGFQPADVVHTDRLNIAGYAEGELDVSKELLLSGAVRLENYSDFGFTHNYKAAARYKVQKNLNLRGSVSTGFRAPSLQQINYSSTFTTVQAGAIAEVKIAPNKNAITRAAGIEQLKQERSINASLGAAWMPVKGLSIAIDGYWVRIKDRVVLSGQFDGSDPNIDPDLAAAMARLNVSLAQFFTNAVNTSNRGIDLVADYSKQWKQQRVRLLLAANMQKMTIDKINVPAKLSKTEQLRQTFLSDREQAYLLASAPKVKLSFNPEWGCKRYTVGARFTYFGKLTTLGYGEDGLGINPMVPSDADANVKVPDRYVYPGKAVTDLYASVRFAKGMSFQLGADNIFNVHPALGIAPGAKGWAYNTESGGPWDAVQMGGNGRRLFTRVTFSF